MRTPPVFLKNQIVFFFQGSCLLKPYSIDTPVQKDNVSVPFFFTCLNVTSCIGYRYERSGSAGTGLYAFSGDFATSQRRQAFNADRQRKEKEAYERRLRDLGRFIFHAYLL